ncbi:MAG: 4-oxalocrotonate tautomerase, partial [Actinobacteria bacterium]|nr:4-oxalocrotonate tautomerase [Actinomycetota bacterium]
MPFITVQLIEGRSVEQKHALIKEISEAAIRV